MFRRQMLRQSRMISESLTALPRQAQRSSPFSSTTFTSSTRPSACTTSTSSQLGRRWQSTEAEKKTGESSETPPAKEESKTEASKEDQAKAELEKKNKEIIDLKDKYLRSVADYRNLQDRTKRDMDSARQFAIQRFATDLLDSIDNLDRALGSVPQAALGKDAESTSEPNKDLLSLYSGLKMTEDILMGTLKKHGLERFDPSENGGRKFDPNTDEATFFTKVEGKEDGDVFFVQSKGFKLNGRVVRAAKVGVVKNS